jgi:sugar phosphate isomerase/epimerase
MAGAGAVMAAAALPVGAEDKAKSGFRYSLNTATIMGQKQPLTAEIEMVSKAGYDAIEPWVREIDGYVKGGGTLKDLRKLLADSKLTVENAIGFFDWVVDDEVKRAKGLEEAKRVMDMIAQIGCTHVAAPPCGATNVAIPVEKAAERYKALLELGDKAGVIPMLELWGTSKTLSKIDEGVAIAKASGHAKASLLLDVFHLYKAGCDFNEIKKLDGAMLPVFHMNDYPAEPPRDKANDSMRVYPGDGAAPLKQLMADLRAIGFKGILSLEIFNRAEWAKDAGAVVKTGLEKMKSLGSGV